MLSGTRNWIVYLEGEGPSGSRTGSPPRSGTPSLLSHLESIASRDTPTDHAVPNGSSIAIAGGIPGGIGAACGRCLRRRARAGAEGIGPEAQHRRPSAAGRGQAESSRQPGQRDRRTHRVRWTPITSSSAPTTPTSTTRTTRPWLGTVVRSQRRPTLWFNYRTERNQRWASEELRQRYGFKVQFPDGDATGVKLELSQGRSDQLVGSSSWCGPAMDSCGLPLVGAGGSRRDSPPCRSRPRTRLASVSPTTGSRRLVPAVCRSGMTHPPWPRAALYHRRMSFESPRYLHQVPLQAGA